MVGVGVNVLHSREDFAPELAEVATSLAQELGHPVSRPVLAAALIEELDRLYQALENDDLEPYRSAYRASCVNLGKTVQLLEHGQRETAQAVGIDDAFGLIVRDADGRERVVRSGEVSVRGLYGYVD